MASMDDLLSAFEGLATDDKDGVVRQFARVMQVPEADATFYLESCGNSVELAINMFLNAQGQSGRGLVSTQDYQQQAAPVAVFEGDISGVGDTLSQQRFAPGQEVTMIWRFRNTGAAAWPLGVELGCADGHQMQFACPNGIGPCAPGENIDVAVTIAAPPAGGSYGTAFRLLSPVFGYFTEPLWVMLEVDETLAQQQQAPQAQFGAQAAQQQFGGAGFPLGGAAQGPFNGGAFQPPQPPAPQFQQQQQQHVQQYHQGMPAESPGNVMDMQDEL